MLIDFAGKQVMVVGAAHGIGAAIAIHFAARRADVWACDPRATHGKKTSHPEAPGFIFNLRVDATKPDEIAAAVAEASGDAGAIDILVYVAGGVQGQTAHPIEEVSLEAWRDIVDVNLTGAFLCAQAVAPGMKRAGTGRIVTISSRAALQPSLTGIQSYAAAKHGQIGLVRQLAQELGPFGITVNSVAPGFMATNPDSERQWNSYTKEFQESFFNRIAMRRMGTPDDIAHAVLFLASDYASWITGQVLPVTGAP